MSYRIPMTTRLTEEALREEIVAVIDRYPTLDLTHRLRKELRRNQDSNSTNRHRRAVFMDATVRWASKHLSASFDERTLRATSTPTGVLAEHVFNAFSTENPKFNGKFGKRLFYATLRGDGYDIRQFDGFGVEGRGPNIFVGMELQP